jgi:non-canonical (house-cleaning) NTP pyrophosphatase
VFWRRFQSGLGVEVTVDGLGSDRLLGVRDGFRRYFHDGLDRPVPVVVVPQDAVAEPPRGLAASDEEAMRRARARAGLLQSRLGTTYHFYVASEAGVHALDFGGDAHQFVRLWTVVLSRFGESFGSSGSIELPPWLWEGGRAGQPPADSAVPGTRRRGGIVSSLTGGLETRRRAVALSTFLALSSMFYGVLESGAVRER